MKYLIFSKTQLLLVYRTLSLIGLFGIFGGIIWYMLTFFVLIDGVSRWGAPIVLSPTQEKVLAFQPQVEMLEANLIKNQVDLTSARLTVDALTTQLTNVEALQGRLNNATSVETANLTEASKSLKEMLRIKTVDIVETDKLVANVQELLATVDNELAARLITKDQADQRKITLRQALNATTDAKTNAINLDYQQKQLMLGANTLSGGDTSLSAINSIKVGVDLQALHAQLQIQITTAKATASGLSTIIGESERVLAVAKSSPYYRALRDQVTVAFVPYNSFKTVHIGDTVYDCELIIAFCFNVGQVVSLFEAEEYARHPLFKTDLKGRLVEIKFTDQSASRSQVIFIGRRPLLF